MLLVLLVDEVFNKPIFISELEVLVFNKLI